jgi:putative ABC transport system permease protein
LLTESLVLALIGGAAGIFLARSLLAAYVALGPSLPRLAEVSVDWRVAAFALGVALVAGTTFGLLPLAFGAVGGAKAGAARGGTAGRGQQLFRNGLVALEFALALPLLVAAALLANSLARLHQVDPGFPADHLLIAGARLPETAYPDNAARVAFWQRALPEIMAIPGVRSASLATGSPPDAPGNYNNFDIVGRPAGAQSQPVSPWTPVAQGFFDTLGVRVVEGRNFEASDFPTSPDDQRPTVVVVGRSWAEHYFPGESAVGKRLIEGGNTEQPVTIVGVVEDVKWNGLRNPADSVYASIEQGWNANPAVLYLRTNADPLAVVEPLRATLRRLEPALVPNDVTTMESRLTDSLSDQRHWAAVIAGFALSALALAAIGVFGVLAYYVSRQQREIGIRLSLGADARKIVAMVLKRGVVLATVGSLVGVGLSLLLTRSIESLLFDVSRTDLPTLLAATTAMLAIAFAACWLPARRAAKTSPVEALRYE